jgi:hypothetical protein
MFAESLSNSEIFSNAEGAAFGGFVGVLLLFLVKWLVELTCSHPKLVATYQCASDINKGQAGEVEGELQHHHGKRVDNKDELGRLGVNNPVWEWTRDHAGGNPYPKGASVFYGPRATDLTDPGLYVITFRIRGTGFTKPKEITNDVNLLKLDVNCVLTETSWSSTGGSSQVSKQDKHECAAQRFLRVSHLAQDGWQEFNLQVWSNGRGIWEYRVWAFDGAGSSPDNFSGLDKGVKIFFDSVTIKKTGKLNLPSV